MIEVSGAGGGISSVGAVSAAISSASTEALAENPYGNGGGLMPGDAILCLKIDPRDFTLLPCRIKYPDLRELYRDIIAAMHQLCHGTIVSSFVKCSRRKRSDFRLKFRASDTKTMTNVCLNRRSGIASRGPRGQESA